MHFAGILLHPRSLRICNVRFYRTISGLDLFFIKNRRLHRFPRTIVQFSTILLCIKKTLYRTNVSVLYIVWASESIYLYFFLYKESLLKNPRFHWRFQLHSWILGYNIFIIFIHGVRYKVQSITERTLFYRKYIDKLLYN